MSNDAVNQSSRPPAVLPHPFGDAVLERLREVAGRVVAGVPGIERVMAAYFALAEDDELLGRDPSQLAGLVDAHLAAGAVRRPGEDVVRIVTPHDEAEPWDTGGSSLVFIVTDDRPFLVDTVAMEVGRQGWSVRSLFHPQFVVERGADGAIVTMAPKGNGDAGTAESWICLEAYPELGRPAREASAALVEGVRLGLQAVRAAVDDWSAMEDRLQACIQDLDSSPQPVSPGHVRNVIGLLEWLAAGHFVFLGSRDYTVDGDTFTAVPGSGLGILRGGASAGEFHAVASADDPDILVMTKDSRRSPVHRPAWLDYVAVRTFDRDGRQIGERRFVGLLAAAAYSASTDEIPVVADKVRRLVRKAGFEPDSHSGHALAQIVASYPRDELFQASVEDLFDTVARIALLQERSQVRLFVRPDEHGRFLNCLVFLPRDRFKTSVRLRMQQVLLDAVGGESLEYQSSVTESQLARLLFVIKLPDGVPIPDYDIRALERQLTEATREWDDLFNDEAKALPSEQRGVDFGEAYEAVFTASQALKDLLLANQLQADDDLRFALYAPDDPDDAADLRFKVISLKPMALTTVMPHLSTLGVRVIDERPFEWDLRGRPVFVYDFGFTLAAGETVADWTPQARQRFCEAFDATYHGRAHAGTLNALVLTAGLTWREVAWLRGVSRYLQQAGIPFSMPYVAVAVNAHPAIAALLVAAFRAKFDPDTGLDAQARRAASEKELERVEEALDTVSSLDQDRILRMFMAVLRAMVRTNAFDPDAGALAFKLLPAELTLLPEPRPAHEIFVYSPRVQGVHLRFGAVARGGLRWSDRKEDFRTEVLGLVKAQMVKNTVIVPVGAKGGFVPFWLPDPAVDRQAWLEEGKACYRLFIESLLSVTDNLVDGAVVPPPRVVRFDDDDTYLVVAADKGTATFSDIANEISVRRGFWLGDAFASGGSAGYDHKGMGITARGAWESVKRHFFERGIDCQTTDFTCVGIGDMAGDVFGNGMLRSEHTRLVAAFNHLHIFIDPDPDAATSFAERQRLFELPRSAWSDYDASLISEGGGVFERSAKSIAISPQARVALGIADGVTALTPADLISAILRAPVDLLWNGGIGTYVKAASETHEQVGDKANNSVRVNGCEVRASIAGEGGNLGWTQLGRIEYALAGGRVNTDFIDNSAGVDTSDHEVNIKILLSGEVASGALPVEERTELLASMTDEVATLVLVHNLDQNLALATTQARATELAGAHEEWMAALVEAGLLNRNLEFLPSTDQMEARIAEGRGLTRPELAVLLSYTKIWMERQIIDSDLPEDEYLRDRLVSYFPWRLREEYRARMEGHPLRREIVATVTTNRFVNSLGPSAAFRLGIETGAGVRAIIRAQLAARAILSVAQAERDLTKVSGLSPDTDIALRVSLQQLVERATRWLLHNRRVGFDIRAETDALSEGVAEIRAELPQLLTPRQQEEWRRLTDALVAGGAPEELAAGFAADTWAHVALPVVQVARSLERPALEVACVYFRLAEALSLDEVADHIERLPRQDRWDAMARAALRDDLIALHASLTEDAAGAASAGEAADAIVASWLAARRASDEAEVLRRICDEEPDLARMSVALRTIRTLLA